jgi:hypothetical protein
MDGPPAQSRGTFSGPAPQRGLATPEENNASASRILAAVQSAMKRYEPIDRSTPHGKLITMMEGGNPFTGAPYNPTEHGSADSGTLAPQQAPQAMAPQSMAQAPAAMPQMGAGGVPTASGRGFDYDAALAALMPQKPKSKGIFGSGLKWYDIAGLLGDALTGASGGNGHAYADRMLSQRMEQDRRRFETMRSLTEWKHRDYDRQNAADLQAAQPFTLGRSRYRFDPATGQTTTLQTAPMDFETYASSQGFEPGSPEYNAAAQDYILRGNGPTAVGLDASLDDYRTGNRMRLETQRAGNRSALEGQRQAGRSSLRSMPTYRDLHPSAGGSRGSSIPTVKTPQEAMALPPGTKFRTPDGRLKVRP